MAHFGQLLSAVATVTAVAVVAIATAVHAMSVDQDATCSALDRRQYLDGDTGEPVVEEDFRGGQVTVLYSVAPPKPFLTRRIYTERDPVYYNKIAFDEQIRLFHNLLDRFESNGYGGAVQFILGASAARYPEESDYVDYEDFLDNVTSVAASYNISVYPNPLNDNGTYAMYGLREFQVYVLDRCSRIAYIIEPPWSLIQYSYVKAAVLSTLYDRPCGECDADNFLNSSLPEKKIAMLKQLPQQQQQSPATTPATTTATSKEPPATDLKPYDESTESSEEMMSTEEEPEPERTTEDQISLFQSNITDADNVTLDEDAEDDPFANLTVSGPELSIPLKIVIPAIHIHYDQPKSPNSYNKYSYIVFQSDNPAVHQHHYASDRPELREVGLANATSNSTLRVVGVLWPLPQLAEILNTSTVFYDDRTTQVYRKVARYNASGFDELEELSVASQYAAWKRRQADRAEQAKTEKRHFIRKHYERLIQWLSWQFDKS